MDSTHIMEQAIKKMSTFIQEVNDQIDQVDSGANFIDADTQETHLLIQDALEKFEQFLAFFGEDPLVHLMSKSSYQQLMKNVERLCSLASTADQTKVYQPGKGIITIEESVSYKEIPRQVKADVEMCNWRLDAAMDELILSLKRHRIQLEKTIGKDRTQQLASYFETCRRQMVVELPALDFD